MFHFLRLRSPRRLVSCCAACAITGTPPRRLLALRVVWVFFWIFARPLLPRLRSPPAGSRSAIMPRPAGGAIHRRAYAFVLVVRGDVGVCSQPPAKTHTIQCAPLTQRRSISRNATQERARRLGGVARPPEHADIFFLLFFRSRSEAYNTQRIIDLLRFLRYTESRKDKIC